MKIVYCVEGSADQAVVQGLKERWCKNAELVPGKFRGSKFRRRDISKECKVHILSGADLVIFLRDANTEDWRDVQRDDSAECPEELRDKVIFGVCDRNIECWLASAHDHLANHLGIDPQRIKVKDPAPELKKAFNLQGFEKEQGEQKVTDYVKTAPLKRWMANRSFEAFFSEVWTRSKVLKCDSVEDLRGFK